VAEVIHDPPGRQPALARAVVHARNVRRAALTAAACRRATGEWCTTIATGYANVAYAGHAGDSASVVRLPSGRSTGAGGFSAQCDGPAVEPGRSRPSHCVLTPAVTLAPSSDSPAEMRLTLFTPSGRASQQAGPCYNRVCAEFTRQLVHAGGLGRRHPHARSRRSIF
jgi:hypothetical protein